MIVNREGWLLIVGSDLSNPHWGITLCVGERPPVADYRMWTYQWRLNIRWPVTFNARHYIPVSKFARLSAEPAPNQLGIPEGYTAPLDTRTTTERRGIATRQIPLPGSEH